MRPAGCTLSRRPSHLSHHTSKSLTAQQESLSGSARALCLSEHVTYSTSTSFSKSRAHTHSHTHSQVSTSGRDHPATSSGGSSSRSQSLPLLIAHPPSVHLPSSPLGSHSPFWHPASAPGDAPADSSQGPLPSLNSHCPLHPPILEESSQSSNLSAPQMQGHPAPSSSSRHPWGTLSPIASRAASANAEDILQFSFACAMGNRAPDKELKEEGSFATLPARPSRSSLERSGSCSRSPHSPDISSKGFRRASASSSARASASFSALHYSPLGKTATRPDHVKLSADKGALSADKGELCADKDVC